MNVQGFVISCACALTTTVAAQGPAKPITRPAAGAPVEVRTSLTRTAVWVGDPVTYLIELRCAPNVDILTDDLAAERLPLKGLELLGVEAERDASVPDRVTHRMRYRLVAYDLDAPAVGIGPIPVRYYIRQPGKRAEDMVPAGEVSVPPLALSLRSTIPENAPAALRDDRSVRPVPRWVAMAKPVGLGLVALAVAPVALWGAGLVHRARRTRSGRPIRQTRRQRLAALEKIKALDVSTPEALRDAYAQLDAWVRANLQQATGVTAGALTPAEVVAAVTRPPRALKMDQVQDVLLECERAKYAPEPPSAERWDAVLLEARHSAGAAR